MEKVDSRKQGTIALLMATVAVIWGFVFLVLDILVDLLDVVQILTLRWTVAALAFLIMALLGVYKLEIRRDNIKLLIINGLVSSCLYPLCETYGVKLTNASVLAIFEALAPVMTLMVGCLFFGKKTNKLGLLSLAMAITGVVVCTVFMPGFSTEGRLIGYFLLASSAILTGLYAQFSARLSKDTNAMTVTAGMAFSAAIFHNILNLISGHGLSTYTIVATDVRLLAGILFLGLFSSVVCFLCYNLVMGMTKNTALAANINAGLVTVIGVLAGVFIAGDPAGWYTVIGLAITLGGVALSTKQV